MLKRKYPGSVHNHTDHSNNRLRDCINKVSDLIDYAIELGHECVAITDHETLSSFIQVEKYAEKVIDKENGNYGSCINRGIHNVINTSSCTF